MMKKSLVLAFVVILAAFGKVRADALYGGNFTLSASPTVETVAPGGTATFTLTVSPVPVPGYPPRQQGEVELRALAPRSGVKASVSPAVVELGATPVMATGTVVVANTPSVTDTDPVVYPVVFSALGAGEVRTVTVYVSVN